MNGLKIFENVEFGRVRTVVINEEPWFVGKDVAEALGYKDTSDALKKHVSEDDKRIFKPGEMPTLKMSNYGAYVINESGLYALIFGSKLESAQRFKHWVTSEVLPSLRRNGGYIMNQENMTPEQIMAAGLKAAQQIIENLKANNESLTQENKRMKPKEIFADAVSASHTSILIGDLAKLLKQNGIDTGQKRLFVWMRENGYLIKRKGTDWNMPTQKAMELKLFEVKESVINNPDGSSRINRTTKVTGKGQQYFVNKFLESV